MKTIELDGIEYNLDDEDEALAFHYQFQVFCKKLDDENQVSLYNQGRADQKKKDAEICRNEYKDKKGLHAHKKVANHLAEVIDEN